MDLLKDPEAVRRQIGLSGQYAAVDEYLTGFENLEMVGRLYRLGKGIAQGTADELRGRVGGERIEVVVETPADLARAESVLSALGASGFQTETQARRITAPVTGGAEALESALLRLRAAGVAIVEIGLRRPTLDDVFLALTGHGCDTVAAPVEEPAREKEETAA